MNSLISQSLTSVGDIKDDTKNNFNVRPISESLFYPPCLAQVKPTTF